MILIKATPLCISSFAPYGSLVSPDEEVRKLDEFHKNANQGTAIKITQVAKLVNAFEPNAGVKNINCNLFRCFPTDSLRRNIHLTAREHVIQHEIKVLEKHPSSTQTFVPMGRDTSEGYAYLVVTALSDHTGNPDFTTLGAFLCKPNQAVTYNAGVWHAPMIVLGKKDHLDFAVFIYEASDSQHPELDLVEYQLRSQLYVELYSS